jgi:riboflavin biosynthesis pyrimidine reductase
MTTLQERIEEIDSILRGAETVRHGDKMVTHNFAELRKERAYLMGQLGGAGSSFRRVVMTSRG